MSHEHAAERIVPAHCPEAGAVEGVQRASLRVEGLDCPDCARSVVSAVERVPGVRCADLNYASATLLVDFELGANPLEEVFETVRAAGYGAAGIDTTGAVEATAPRPWVDRYRAEIATVGSGLFAGLGGLVGWLGAPESLAVAAYAVAIAFGAVLVWRRVVLSLKARMFDMNVLMTVAVIGAAALGEWGEGATVYFLFALGGLLESRSLARTRRSIRDLMALTPELARVRRWGDVTQVEAEHVVVGETAIVRPGERVPLDGVITTGVSAVDESAITGESIPATKEVGDRVFAGTLNTSGLIEYKVTSVTKDSTLARIVFMVEEAQASKAPSQTLVERFSRWYTPSVLVLAAVVAVVPPVLGPILGASWGGWAEWIERALVLLVVSCPCALVISTPVSIVSAITRASRDGVLVKGGAFLEIAARVKAVAFDKTGTLTSGHPEVASIVTVSDRSESEALTIAAALEANSNHPIAQAVVRAAKVAVTEWPAVSEYHEEPGVGIRGVIDGVQWQVCSPGCAQDAGMLALNGAAAVTTAVEERGETALVLFSAAEPVAVIGIADAVRPETAGALAALRRAGAEHLVMLTGDNDRVAAAVAQQVGMTEFRARLLPEAKTRAVGELRASYGAVAMVGDGVNDAPALAAADIGIAMGAAGTDTALETADVALMRDDLSALPGFLRLGRRTVRTIKQNVAFSILVKVVFLGLAVTGNATLWMAVFADTGVALLVIVNGMRLLRRPNAI